MAEQPNNVRLEDIISYTPETYFKDDELKLIRAHFNGATGSALLKVMRKALIPTISDPDLPIEECMKDNWMARVDFSKMQIEEAKAVAMGLQLAEKVIIGALMELRTIANVKDETDAERKARQAKDSTQ